MSPIKTAGELRSFLADILVGIKNGDVDFQDANAIAKIAGQINQSLSTEVNTALQLERLGKGAAKAGSMLIGSDDGSYAPVVASPKWCEQCETLTAPEDAAACKSRYCSLRPAQGIEAAAADETERLDAKHESPVVEDHAPEPSTQTHTTKKKGE